MRRNEQSLELTGNEVRLTRGRGDDAMIVAKVLQVSHNPRGFAVEIWCDRRIHDVATSLHDGWTVCGALVSVFTRPDPDQVGANIV